MEFVHMNGPRRRGGFTLVELLVSIGIIALLVSILLPALQRARDSAATIKCAANLRSIGQGILAYAAENNQYLPAAWSFQGTTITLDNNGNPSQVPTSAVYGYVHWTSFIFGTVSPDAFECPVLTKGGFPAADPLPGNFDTTQGVDTADAGSGAPPSLGLVPVTATDGVGHSSTYYPDAQAIRTSYSLNEGICGQNLWVQGFSRGGVVSKRINVLVTLGQVTNQSSTILATEFVDEWGIVSGVARAAPPSLCKSYRAIQPWRADGNGTGDLAQCDIGYIDTGTKLRRSTTADLWQRNDGKPSTDIVTDYQAGLYDANSESTRLDYVGRNHGSDVKPSDRKSNFLYLDGHIETKSIYETLPATTALNDVTTGHWEWGAKCYSFTPNSTSTGN